jgi:hypothetical protein
MKERYVTKSRISFEGDVRDSPAAILGALPLLSAI